LRLVMNCKCTLTTAGGVNSILAGFNADQIDYVTRTLVFLIGNKAAR